jgi:multidrug efflux system membrane fusion protein
MKRKGWIILTIVILAGLIAWRLASNKHKLNEKKKPVALSAVAIPVNIDTVMLGTVEEQLVRTGTLVPWQEADIAATTAGTLQSVGFSLGSLVRRGGAVAHIDSRALQLRLEAAQLQQQKFSKDYARYKVLLAGEATTEANLQEVRYNLDNANNQIAQIMKQMADNVIKAPINGQIVAKNTEAGEFVNPGAILGKVVDNSTLKVDVLVGEADAYKLRTGQEIIVTTELYPGYVFKGKIIFISQQADAAHNYQVQVRLPNPTATPLKAGTFVNVDFIQPSAQPGIQIPRSALAESLKNPYVYVVSNGRSLRRIITVGRDLGSKVEVLAGLQPGELVVTNGQINLSDSGAVTIVRQETENISL